MVNAINSTKSVDYWQLSTSDLRNYQTGTNTENEMKEIKSKFQLIMSC